MALKIRSCGFCGKEKEIKARGLCAACYSRYQKRGSPEYIKVRKPCRIDNCDKLSVSHGLCDMHRKRVERHGHLLSTRGNGWGSKEKHPLYQSWYWFKRNDRLSQEWHDFWQFVKDVGEKPGNDYRFFIINKNKPVYKDNYEWEKVTPNQDRLIYAKNWREENKAKCKNRELKRRFKITIDDYYDLLEKQKGVCIICGEKETALNHKTRKPRNLAVDHDHTTGKIRGLLCTNCNKGLGHFKDSIALLEKAIKYLKQYEQI